MVGIFWNWLHLQLQDSSLHSRMTNLIWAYAPTITVAYPGWRSQIPRCALNDDGVAVDWRGIRLKFI
jgi:hypothetical protein